MSVDYDIVCHAHKERVPICSDGFSGPLLQCDKSLAAFTICHRLCSLDVISENIDDFDDYSEWHISNWKDKFHYDYEAS